MTWIKICGITNLEDALVAAEAGADALGFVFHEKSPRYVAPEAVRKIVEKLPERTAKFGVFVNQTADAVSQTVDAAGLTGVQLQGGNQDSVVADVLIESRPHLKMLIGILMTDDRPESSAMKVRSDRGFSFLLDTGGGTGRVFDWDQKRDSVEAIKSLGNVIVAGGLNPLNVAKAMRVLHPWGVDVASGVEASPGKKDTQKIKAFIAAVREADRVH